MPSQDVAAVVNFVVAAACLVAAVRSMRLRRAVWITSRRHAALIPYRAAAVAAALYAMTCLLLGVAVATSTYWLGEFAGGSLVVGIVVLHSAEWLGRRAGKPIR